MPSRAPARGYVSGCRHTVFPCAGSREEMSERALAEAFARGGWQKVTRLYRDSDIADERCWFTEQDGASPIADACGPHFISAIACIAALYP